MGRGTGNLPKEEYLKRQAKLQKMMKDEQISGWLSEFKKESTRNAYSGRILDFFEATNTTPEILTPMGIKEIKTLVLNYQNKAQEKKMKNKERVNADGPPKKQRKKTK